MDCSVVTDPELVRLCAGLSEELDGLRANPLWVAIITGSAALVGAVIGAVAQFWVQRGVASATKRDQDRTKALHELQEHAVALRKSLKERAAWQAARKAPFSKSPFSTTDEGHLVDLLDASASRIKEIGVPEAATAWRQYAQRHWKGDPVTERAEEEALWSQLLDQSGAWATDPKSARREAKERQRAKNFTV